MKQVFDAPWIYKVIVTHSLQCNCIVGGITRYWFNDTTGK